MDAGQRYADEMLEKIAEELAKALGKTNKIAVQKMKAYLKKHQDIIDKLNAQLERGEITEREYKLQMIARLTTGKEWTEVRDAIAEDMTRGVEDALEGTAVILTAIYLFNRNYANEMIETTLKKRRGQVVKLPRVQKRDLIKPPKPSRPKNRRWHKTRVDSVIRQGMKKGHSIDKIARQLNKVTDTDIITAYRTARTKVTDAESEARMDSFYDAEDAGVKMYKQWDAVKDNRTRTSHRVLDGERIPINEYFSNGLFRPADPNGDPSEIYNCRCRLKGVPEGLETLDEPQAPKGMGRYEWIGQKPVSKPYPISKKEREEAQKKRGTGKYRKKK